MLVKEACICRATLQHRIRAQAAGGALTAAPGSSHREQSMNGNEASPAASPENVSGPMLEPSAFNKNWVSAPLQCTQAITSICC